MRCEQGSTCHHNILTRYHTLSVSAPHTNQYQCKPNNFTTFTHQQDILIILGFYLAQDMVNIHVRPHCHSECLLISFPSSCSSLTDIRQESIFTSWLNIWRGVTVFTIYYIVSQQWCPYIMNGCGWSWCVGRCVVSVCNWGEAPLHPVHCQHWPHLSVSAHLTIHGAHSNQPCHCCTPYPTTLCYPHSSYHLALTSLTYPDQETMRKLICYFSIYKGNCLDNCAFQANIYFKVYCLILASFLSLTSHFTARACQCIQISAPLDCISKINCLWLPVDKSSGSGGSSLFAIINCKRDSW